MQLECHIEFVTAASKVAVQAHSAQQNGSGRARMLRNTVVGRETNSGKKSTNAQGAARMHAPRDLCRKCLIDRGLEAKAKVDVERYPVAGTAKLV